MLFNDEEKTPEKEPIKNSTTTQHHLRCSNCSFEANRDVVGSWNIRLRALKMWGISVPPEGQSMKVEAGRLPVTIVLYVPKVTGNQNGVSRYN